MTQIITVANRRGGVGKTATAHALGAGLSRKGYRVLFIDLDSQCNLTYDIGASGELPLSSLDVLEGRATASEAILSLTGGDIIPASPNLATADKLIDGVGKEYRLKEALVPVVKKYDYIIIDTPPALGVLTINALTASQKVIIPAQAEIHSLQGIDQLYGTIEAVKHFTNKKLKIEGILITRYIARSVISRDMKTNLEEVAREIETKTFSAPIRECSAIKEAQATQTDIYSYAPRSNASKDYEALVDEVLNNRR